MTIFGWDSPQVLVFVGVSHFPLFIFIIGLVMKTGLFSCENSGIDICSDRKLPGLGYVDDAALLSETPGKLKLFLCCPNYGL